MADMTPAEMAEKAAQVALARLQEAAAKQGGKMSARDRQAALMGARAGAAIMLDMLIAATAVKAATEAAPGGG